MRIRRLVAVGILLAGLTAGGIWLCREWNREFREWDCWLEGE
jgi:hypothetical protein